MSKNSLEISPNGTLTFTKINNKQEIVIRNVSQEKVTYKLQSTVFGKFKMRPRWGILKPNEHSHVLITMCKDVELSKKGRDKIVVVCMLSPINAVDFDMTSAFWRHNICYDPDIEKHQLTCHQMDGAGEGGDDDVSDKGAESDNLRIHRGQTSWSSPSSFSSLRTPTKYWR
ncbi:uncharacterized protein LOC108113977 [Drosophila eugracilis]|uniref:uncharacterized protein LOC108113977 n=1 Tax=Drosophila eugracilis TaxID=29029 RepID=UPI0007E6D66E|nr:uncharacterized protein LOC108113977 [Drosophila eugracilis]